MKFVSAAIAICLTPVAAVAADPPARNPAPMLAAEQATFNWTGPYAGLNAGWGSGALKPPGSTLKLKGVLGGAQIGYNYQIGAYMAGLEVDYTLACLNYANSASGTWYYGPFGPDTSTYSYWGKTHLETFGTVRIRTGFAMNSALVYTTGGYAYGRMKLKEANAFSNTYGSLTTTSSYIVSESKLMSGWTLGAGVEYAFTSSTSGKLEYLYASLSKTTNYEEPSAKVDRSNKVNILRGGVNYRF